MGALELPDHVASLCWVGTVVMAMRRICVLLAVLLLVFGTGFAENGADAWLRYAPLDSASLVSMRSFPQLFSFLEIPRQ